MHKNFGKKLMKSEGLVLDDSSTKGEVQFLAVKNSRLRSWDFEVDKHKQHIKISKKTQEMRKNTKNTKKREKTQ